MSNYINVADLIGTETLAEERHGGRLSSGYLQSAQRATKLANNPEFQQAATQFVEAARSTDFDAIASTGERMSVAAKNIVRDQGEQYAAFSALLSEIRS